MKIALIGYGKMGKAIEQIAVKKGHEIVLKIDINNQSDLNPDQLSKADAAIEFTGPHSAFENIRLCLEAGIPTVSGSTGWLDRFEDARQICLQHQGAFVYASNFSIGVNIFFEVNKKLASLMVGHPEYQIQITEIHHTQKKDAPSGTAISLAEQIIQNNPGKQSWVNHAGAEQNELKIISERIDPAPGIHKILYSSDIDDIEIIHTAHSRTGFASGAVLAAEFLQHKKGIFGMKEVLGI